MPAHGGEETFVEPRWPIALAIAIYLALMITLRIYEPDRPALGTRWLVPAVLGGLLVALVLADPARIEGRARWLRRLSGGLILALAVMALAATALLIADFIRGSHVTDSASALLVSGRSSGSATASCSASSIGTSTAVGPSPGIAATVVTATSPSRST